MKISCKLRMLLFTVVLLQAAGAIKANVIYDVVADFPQVSIDFKYTFTMEFLDESGSS